MSVHIQRRLFTVQEYHLMGEAGILVIMNGWNS